MKRKPMYHESPDRVAPMGINGEGSPPRCLVCTECDSIVEFHLEWADAVSQDGQPKETIYLTLRCRCAGPRVRRIKITDLVPDWREHAEAMDWWRDPIFVNETLGGHYP